MTARGKKGVKCEFDGCICGAINNIQISTGLTSVDELPAELEEVVPILHRAVLLPSNFEIAWDENFLEGAMLSWSCI